MKKRICKWKECKKEFLPKTNNQKYCCYACLDKASTKKKRDDRANNPLPEAEAIYWIAKIVSTTDPYFTRKIKIVSFKKESALKQAEGFCAIDEYISELFSKEKVLVWSISTAEKEQAEKNIKIQLNITDLSSNI